MNERKGTRLWFGFFCVLCAAALALSLVKLTAPWLLPGSSLPPGTAGWLVQDKGGRVAVYAIDADGTQVEQEVYDIYVNLLPEPDVLRLRQGIEVWDETALQQLLEDLGG